MGKKNKSEIKSISLNETLFNLMLESISDVILVLEESGIIKYATTSIEKLTGNSLEEVVGKSLFDLIHEDDRRSAKQILVDLLSVDGSEIEIEKNLLRKDGSLRFVVGKAKNLISNPDINGILINLRDITENSQLEETSNKNQVLLSNVEQISKVGGWEYDVKSRKMFWTKETYSIHEIDIDSMSYGSTEHIEKSILCYHESDRVKISEAFENCYLKGIEYKLEFPLVTLKGRNIWVETSAKPFYHNNRIEKVYGNIIDISERKRNELLAEARLKLTEYSYQSDLDSFLQKFLDEAERLTQSKIGFYHFVEEDQETLHLQMWSTNTMNTMCTAEGKDSHYSISKAGVWTDCVKTGKPVIHNDYENLTHKKGLPEGHAPVIRELVVPVFRNNKIIAILGVGNKEAFYDEYDVEIISKLADYATDITERKRAEEAHLEAEKKLTAVLNSNEDRIWAIDRDYNLLYGNKAYENYILKNAGQPAEVGKSIFTNTPFPSFISEWQNYFNRAFNGEVFKIEKSYTLNDKDHHIEYGFNPVKGNDVDYTSIVVFARDITNRKKFEEGLNNFNEQQKKINEELNKKNEELKKSRKATLNIIDDLSLEMDERKKTLNELHQSTKRYLELALQSRTVTWEIDKNGLLVYVSEASEAVYGYKPSEIVNKIYYYDLNPKESRNEFKERTSQYLINHESVTNYENEIVTKNGKRLWVLTNAYPVFSPSEDFIGYQGTDTDITERKKTEEELLESRAEYQNFVEKSNEGIYFIRYDDPIDLTLPVDEQVLAVINKGILSECNLAMAKMYGYANQKELIGKTMLELYGGIINEINYETTKNFVTNNYQIDDLETLEYDIDGNEKYFLNSVIGVIKDNKLHGNWGTQRDNTERKKAEQALINSENRYKMLFEEHSAVKLLINPEDGSIIDANQAASNFYGWSREELKGMKLNSINTVPPEEMKEAIQKVLDQKKVRFEFKHKLADGSIKDVEVFSSRIEIGGKEHLHSIIHDITERKIAERNLSESEEKYRKLVEDSPDAIAIYVKGKIVYANNAAVTLMRVNSTKELIGQSVMQFIHPDSIEMVKKRVMQTQNNRESVPVAEEKFVLFDGSSVDVEVKATPINFKGEDGVQLIVRDISDRKRAQEKITQLSRAVEQSPVSIVITDLDGNIEYANPKTIEITGYGYDEVLGKNPRIFSSGELPKEEYKKLWDSITKGQEWKGELHNKKKNGELYWEYVSISPIKDETGKFAHYLAVKEDITERKEIEKDLIMARDRAETANKFKDAFIANISHEIRTPLNGILGMTSIIKEAFIDKAAEDERDYFTSVEISSKRLMKTVDLIVNFSRLQVGDFKINPIELSLSTLIKNVVNEYSPIANEKSITLNFKSSITNSKIFTDEYMVSTSLINIVDNAIKFTDAGSVNIEMYRNQSNLICIDVSDTGVGISDDYLPKLFTPYSQEESGYNRAFEGVGLGLSLVKKFLDMNNISITVESKKNEGSKFTLIFNDTDLVELKTEVVENIIDNKNKITNPESKTSKPAILVVEDDGINQLYLKSLLVKDYEIVIASNAAKATKAFEENDFDLILMDISLKGGMNGLELTKLIRDGNKNPNIPIIAVTGHAFPEDRQRTFEAGCNDYLSKPFESFELLEKIVLNISR